MSVTSAARPPCAHRRPGQQLVAAAAARIRQPPNPGGLARRRLVINLAKWLLPAVRTAASRHALRSGRKSNA